MSEIQRLPHPNPVHPNTKSTTQITNGTTTTKTNIGLPVCRNCKTQTTPLWRRDETGQVLCNACGLFLKLHGRPRPISLKTDTIKLRNRIKQQNFLKQLSPNTPELKLKDLASKVSIQPNHMNGHACAQNGVNGMNGPHLHVPANGMNLSLLAGKQRLPTDSPFAGMMANNGAAYRSSLGIHSPLQHLARTSQFSGGAFPQQMGHFHPRILSHQVQLLHYPSSTPTQFAPGLQRITSPLLLSTAPSKLNARSSSGTSLKTLPGIFTSPPSSLTAIQAAGALENMSNELGHSASFKSATSTSASSVSDVALMGGSRVYLKSEDSSHTTPLLALRDSPNPPLLPALGSGHETGEKVVPSPSFRPKFPLMDAQTKQRPLEHPIPYLPPIHNISGMFGPPQLPHISSNLRSAQYSAHTTPENKPPQASDGINLAVYGPGYHYAGPTDAPTSQAPAGSGSAAGSGSNSGSVSGNAAANQGGKPDGQDHQERNPLNNNNNSNNNNNDSQGGGAGSSSNNTYEVNVLKTRISELELVNDLYRTRIMELEAMEQAARLRENSMRKRLDDLLKAQGYEDSLSMLNNTMKVLKREDAFAEDLSKRQKTG